MPKDKQLIDFSGILDSDSSPEQVNPANYTDAKNISFLTDNTESTGNHIPMRGNMPVFNIGSVSQQNKVIRLYTRQKSSWGSYGYLIYVQSQSGNIIPDNSGNPLNPNNPIVGSAANSHDITETIPNQAADLQGKLNGLLGTACQVTGTITQTTSLEPGYLQYGYLDIYFNGSGAIPGYDINLYATDSAFYGPLLTKPDWLYFEPQQEAYDISAVGELKSIGSNDLLADLYLWSACVDDLPLTTTKTITSVINNGGRFQVVFSVAHGLVTGQKIALSESNTALDGEWIVSVINPTTIKLEEYYTTYTPAAMAVISPLLPLNIKFTTLIESVGEIGAAVYDENLDLWTYTRLLRSKEFNFRTKKQIDCRPAVRTTDKDSFYFTDDYNVPRNFYYTKPFITDGALESNGGRYSYGSISQETTNVISTTGAKIEFVKQHQAGGAITSGNWRYAIRFLSESLAATDPSQLTNPVPVYTAQYASNASNLIGDEPNTITPKINELLVTGIVPGLYKFIELLGINYVGDSLEGFVISRTLLDGVSESLTIRHTGAETDVSNLDTGLLNKISAAIRTAKSNEIIDNRLIYSNLTFNQQKDLLAWALTFKHTLKKKLLPTSLTTPTFADPDTVNKYAGYMFNETMRFGIRVRFKDGGYWSDPFFVDDICFTTYATNVKPDGTSITSQWSDPTRRNGSFADFTIEYTGGMYSPYITFEDIDLDYLVDGVPIRNLIDKIEPVRCEVIPEITSGIGVLSVWGNHNFPTAPSNYWWISSEDPAALPAAPNPPLPTRRIEYPFACGDAYTTSLVPTYPSTFTGDTEYISFYSPDLFPGKETLVQGGKLINFGQPDNYLFYNSSTSLASIGSYRGTLGTDSGNGPAPVQVTTAPLSYVVSLAQGEDTTIAANLFRKKIPMSYRQPPIPWPAIIEDSYAYNSAGFVFKTTPGGGLTNPSGYTDYGLRYVQYYRETTDKYGNPNTSRYITCGTITDIDTNTASPLSIDVFGGDTFTCRNYFKNRYPSGWSISPPFPASGILYFGAGIVYFTQSRANTALRMKAIGTTSDLFPAPSISINSWLNSSVLAFEDYQNGYSIRNEVQSWIAYNPDLPYISSRPNWLMWSDLNLGDSPKDSYRSFPPGNFKVLNGSYGAVTNHVNAHGELLTFQERAFMRNYFNTRGTLEVKGITEVLIGDASVMSRDGVTLSRFGSLHKWGIIHGVSPNGDDVYMWLNTENKVLCHYGLNGTLTVSDKGVKSFFANNLTWLKGKDSPAAGEGICGVYDQRYNNFIWSVRGKMNMNYWSATAIYQPGARVFFSSDPFSVFGDVYQASNLNTGLQPDISSVWTKIEDNGAYSNAYTIIYSGFKTGVICFASFVPKIYHKWQNTFLTPRYISPQSQLYLHNKGNYLTWYEYSGDNYKLQEQGYLTGIVNKFPEQTKWFETFGIDSSVVPERINLQTKNHISFLLNSEFEQYEDSWFSPIKEDSTISGVNDGNTSLLWGKWLKVTFRFAVDTYQQLSNIVCNFQISHKTK